MYELFVLGQLMTGDKHGYLLQESLKRAIGPFRRISSGTLYPLLGRMADQGWIRLRIEEEQEGGRPRKIYGLTASGRERFMERMAKPLEYDMDIELTFRFKMACFPFVSKGVRIACLEQYLQYLDDNLEYVQAEEKVIAKKPVPEPIRFQMLRSFDYRKHVGLAEIRWVTAELERIQAEDD